ncbi:hypothetical protein IB286_01460 [Spongiibacter sp. KMU-158]|uniref:Uncharacterized protein n=1 Tax=Spongiibacter pelagi TaxID=2760804 RepID=A0A927BY21_9GAMM|nr:hypothetical protein [Spongiibacter pelagi]MBD2857655.1 hypothetical protein [Spongiibacter pelagi]
MKRFLIALILAALCLFALVFAAALFLDSSPNKLHYRVFIDANNQIFINGELGTENRVYDLARDMTVDFELEYDPMSTLYFCFKERGCRTAN